MGSSFFGHLKQKLPLLAGVVIFAMSYFFTHIWHLTSLPVFADESIYIRWAQLILDDPKRYFFFALNDGKTPLFIWLLAPLQLLFSDQLWAGRILSVIIGFGQVIALSKLTQVLGGKTKAQILSLVFGSILPFWFFHHRLALIDSLLALFLTLCLILLVKLLQTPTDQWKQRTLLAGGAGIMLGLAFWTKVPAVLFIPVTLIWPLREQRATRHVLLNYLWIGVVVGLSLMMFASLLISPAFGQLFARGGDFLFPVNQVLAGKWRETIPSIPTYLNYFLTYSHPVLLALFGLGLFSKKRTKTQHALFWSALLFALPMVVMGRVVYARYFLPSMIFLTVGAAMYWEELFETHAQAAHSLILKTISGLILALCLANVIGYSLNFMIAAWLHPNQLNLVTSDKVQYLTEWSSGHGIHETYEFILQQTTKGKVAVATEGYFGTLPDALLMYLHRQPVTNLYLEGIGQPVLGLPDSFITQTTAYPTKYLVVNSHRMKMKLPREKLVRQFCRPDSAPCLQIWDISDISSTEVTPGI